MRLQVDLAEAPSDVLIFLAGHDDPVSFDEIVTDSALVVAPGLALSDAAIAASRALRLLIDLGLVRVHHYERSHYSVTRDGYAAVVNEEQAA